MSFTRQSVIQILNEFQCWSQTNLPEQCGIESLGNNGGYSGALLWKIALPDSSRLCLRRWPRNPTQLEHVTWIHQVLQNSVAKGFPAPILPLPFRTTRNLSALESNGFIYELTPWLPGQADFSADPSPSKTEAVSTLLASFHNSCQSTEQQPCLGMELRGVRQRLEFIATLKKGLLNEIAAKISGSPIAAPGHQLIDFFRTLEPTISHRLSRLTGEKFCPQVCIRDIWHDHVLFQDEKVSGLIDFGAMGIDHVGTDIARLFGSLFQNSIDQWSLGLAAYRAIRELSDLELELIDVYDRSSTVLAGMNWLNWILVEKRKFDSFVPIIKRMELLSQRMRDWI